MTAAKRNLEQILLQDADYVPAYAEFARVAMKTNWGPEGLNQAEKYLLSALAIDPKHANTRVLLGYVYAHQKRYQEAESELVEAATIGTSNLWLWANWGELLLMQHRDDLALEKYMQAVSGERTYDTYDRARLDAYNHLFAILGTKNEFDKMDSLHKKRAQEFATKYPCFFGDYGRFRLTHYGDYQGGIANSKKAIDEGCGDEEARYTLGLSYYLAWSRLSGDEKNKAVNQARVFLPDGPRLLYELARSGETSKIIPDLLRSGSSLNSQDNDKFNALAYSLFQSDLDAARRLVGHGAKFDDVVGEKQYPVALIPIMNQDVKGVAMMKESGIDFAKVKFDGSSAIDYAKRIGNPEIIAIVKGSAKYSL